MILPGDLNLDGVVTVVDFRLLLLVIVGKVQATAAMLSAGDLNGDGVVNVQDVLLLGALLVGVV